MQKIMHIIIWMLCWAGKIWRNIIIITINRFCWFFFIIFSFSWNLLHLHFVVFANSMVFVDRLAMVEQLPINKYIFCFLNNVIKCQWNCTHTKSVSKTPAAKIKTVCENCWTIPPQIKPTMPNNVIIIRDKRSARPCPSKSWKKKLCIERRVN